MKLHSFIVTFGTFIISITFLTALLSIKKEKPHYFKYIFVFIILGLALSTNTISSNYYTWRYNMKTGILIEQLITVSQFVMLSSFFRELLQFTKFVKIIKCLFFLSIIIQIFQILIVQLTNTEIRPTTISNLFLLILCYFYVRDLMNNNPTLILIKSSSFWIVMGISFYSGVGFPVSSLIPFISKAPEYSNLRFQIFSIYNVSAIIMYLFIIKSYLCLRHPQNL